MNSEADQLLIEEIRRGDERAWSRFISRFEGRLFAFVNARLRDRAASEDVVQETFVGFLTSLPNYDDSTRLETFLFSIAAHKLTDVLRRQGRRPTVALPGTGDSGTSDLLPGSARRASSLMMSREGRKKEHDVVVSCLTGLIEQWVSRGEFERLKCVELLFVRGWANKDVAAHLGISEHAVANHKYFVVAKLKDAAAQARLDECSLPELQRSPSAE